MTESDVPISTWKLGHQRTQSIFQYMTFTSYYLMIKWTHSLPSMPSLAVIVCLSSAVTERKPPDRCSSNITLILLALGRALSQKILWHQLRDLSVRSMVCLRLIHATKHKWSCYAKVVHKRLYNLRCSEVPYHAFTLPSNNMEPSPPAAPWSSSSRWNGLDAQGRPVSATATLSATYA